jgi:hypothetical protein
VHPDAAEGRLMRVTGLLGELVVVSLTWEEARTLGTLLSQSMEIPESAYIAEGASKDAAEDVANDLFAKLYAYGVFDEV